MLLTLAEVLDQIRKAPQPTKKADTRTKDNPNRPEYYIPRITRRFANFLTST